MSKNLKTLLRKSLDAVDRHRRRLIWLLAIAASRWRGSSTGWPPSSRGDVPTMIVDAVMVLFFSTLGLVVLIVFQLTVATKRIPASDRAGGAGPFSSAGTTAELRRVSSRTRQRQPEDPGPGR